MNLINQVLISGITIIFTVIFYIRFLKIGKGKDVIEELNEWKGTEEKFVKFKEFQYRQTFQLVFAMLALAITASFAVVNYRELIALIGGFSYFTIVACILFVMKRFLYLIHLGHQRATDKMKVLLKRP